MRKYESQTKLLLFYCSVILLFLVGTTIGNQAVSVFSERIPVVRKHCIVIDAGHGGEDGGAVSCTGKSESSYNLQIALRLNDLLHLMGMQTIMIRSTDTSVYTAGNTIAQKKVSDLKHRVNIINQNPNAILISIHQNTFPDAQYHGAQVFYAKSPGSETLAKKLQESFLHTINQGSRRKEKQGSGIYLLDKAAIPGVLVECGFLSNPAEETLLLKPTYQKNICSIIASAAVRFLADT